MSGDDKALARVEANFKSADHAIEKATDIADVKAVADKAEMARIIARKIGWGLDKQNYFAEFKIKAECRAGELLAVSPGKGSHGGNRRSRDIVALEEVGIKPGQSKRWQRMAAVPKAAREEYIKKTKATGGELTSAGILKLAKEQKREELSAARKAIPADLPVKDDRYELIVSDFQKAKVKPASVDWVICDPPYLEKYLCLLSPLSKFSERVLKPGGSLICMMGQSYIPEVLDALGRHLEYHWTLAYLTPGGQAVQVFDRKVNTFWKPLFWFVKGKFKGDWIGDVCKSAVNDNDKKHHEWGQSESGMEDIIERFTRPGQTICDPCCGAGTTGVMAVKLNRLFIGIDCDSKAIDSTRKRLAEL